MTPLLTVMMPVHNAERWISAAIQSVLSQTFRNFELWVLENGSSDRTLEVAKNFRDPRIRIYDLGSVGFQGALQFGLETSKADWIARMDGDDFALPDRLAKQVEVLSSDPALALIGTDYAVVTPFGHIFQRQHKLPSRKLSKESFTLLDSPDRRFCGDPTVVFNRKAALEVGGYDFDFSLGDVPLWIRILEKHRGWEIAEPLYLYRLQPNSVSQTNQDGYAIRRKYGLQMPTLSTTVVDQGPELSRRLRYWRRIIKLELHSGDPKVIRQIGRLLWTHGERKLALISYGLAGMGKCGSWLYGRRYPNPKVRRIDLELACSRHLLGPENGTDVDAVASGHEPRLVA